MITVIMFCFVWGMLGGNGDAIRQSTEIQRALLIMIAIASDLNMISAWIRD